MDKLSLLKKYFGHTSFREGQQTIIDSLMANRDSLGIMPTGAGKSICYQLPALMLDGVSIVISPLISLMKDQVNALNQMGIPAAYLNSSLTERQFRIALSRAYNGRYKIIYVAPERLETEGFMRLAESIHISLITIDEAHCISQWGQDFRPGYLKIRDFIDKLSYRPVIGAFTATATSAVRSDIIRILKLKAPVVVTTGFNRENLYFGVEHPKNKMNALVMVLKRNKDKSGIVYCSTRKNVEEVCDLLCGAGFEATRYHAGLNEEERMKNQEDFLYDRKTIMVATNAFGMGIDKSNVAFVVHYNMPKDIESYYQEAGRAGRDGTEAECILLYAKSDVRTAQWFIEHPDINEALTDKQREEIKERDKERLRQMTFYSTTDRCLRKFILNYFGDKRNCSCKKCSSCCPERQIEPRKAKSEGLIERAAQLGYDNRPLSRVKKEPVRTVLGEREEKLFEILKKLRFDKARVAGVPAFTIFSDAALRDMCVKKPVTRDEFLNVNGVGMVKADKYGNDFTCAIKRFISNSGAGKSKGTNANDEFIRKSTYSNAVREYKKDSAKPAKKSEPAKAVGIGKPWNDVETERLRRELAAGKSIGEIAKNHERRIAEITEKLREFR